MRIKEQRTVAQTVVHSGGCHAGSFLGKGAIFPIYLPGAEVAFTLLFGCKEGTQGVGRLFNSVCEKARGKLLETQDCCALDLFAPKLIQERRNCSNMYSCNEFFSREHQTDSGMPEVFKCVQFAPDSLRSEALVVEHDVE
jgi:hypothetical protein